MHVGTLFETLLVLSMLYALDLQDLNELQPFHP